MSLRHAILGFLSFRPMSGYELKKAFDQSVQHFWPADQSQIYRTLRQLHKDGQISKEVIEREEQLDMKVYDITETGREELLRWLRTPLPVADNREPQLIQVYFGAMMTDTQVLDLLRAHVAELEELLATYQAIYHKASTSTDPVDPRWRFYTMLTLEYGITSAFATHEWMSDVIARIERGEMGIKPVENQLPAGFLKDKDHR